MPFEKGKKKTGGRKAGEPNKSTIEFREAVTNLIEFATPQMVQWLERVAAENPDKALKHIHDFAQFGYPLLARQDVNTRFVNKEGEDLHSEDLKLIEQYKNKLKGANPND